MPRIAVYDTEQQENIHFDFCTSCSKIADTEDLRKAGVDKLKHLSDGRLQESIDELKTGFGCEHPPYEDGMDEDQYKCWKCGDTLTVHDN